MPLSENRNKIPPRLRTITNATVVAALLGIGIVYYFSRPIANVLSICAAIIVSVLAIYIFNRRSS